MISTFYSKYIMKYSIYLSNIYFSEEPLKKMLMSCIIYEKIMYDNKKYFFTQKESGINLIKKLAKQYRYALSIGVIECYIDNLIDISIDMQENEKENIMNVPELKEFADVIQSTSNDEIIRRFILNEV